jgi:hypothetical protein
MTSGGTKKYFVDQSGGFAREKFNDVLKADAIWAASTRSGITIIQSIIRRYT